jgi:hypothetical protein
MKQWKPLVRQLSGNIAATEVILTSDQMSRLDQVSALAGGFSASLTTPMIRRMVYGGHEVTGWTH